MSRIIIWLCAAALFVSGTALADERLSVLMHTDVGEIEIELYPDSAPNTVANFLRYVDGGHYKNSSFYRVVRLDNQTQNKVKIEVIQGGRGEAEALFKPIAHETTRETGITHRDGVISMARAEPGSATSEFFICINDQPELDYAGTRNPDGQGFAAFGRVVSGMDLVRKIQAGQTDTPSSDELEYTSGQMLHKAVAIQWIKRVAK